MYNQEVIEQNLIRIQKNLPFKLREHSIEEVKDMTSYLDSLIDIPLYKETSKLGAKDLQINFLDKQSEKAFKSKKIQDWILTENILSKNNCWYWMERYYWILDAELKEVLYKPNVAQRINQRIASKLQKLRRAIRKWTPKARQQGETVWSQGMLLFLYIFQKNIRAVIASASKDDTRSLSDKFLFALDKQPYWQRPFFTNYRAGEYFKFNTNAFLDLGYGTERSIGRGGTYGAYHLTEVSYYAYPEESLESALFKAIHEFENMLQLAEGTSNGRGEDNYYYRKTMSIKDGMEKGTTSWYLTFFPYFLRRDLYPTPTYIQGRIEAFSKYKPSKETIAHVRAAENYVKSNTDLREELGLSWKMDLEQMFWYETERDSAISQDKLATFLQEHPASLEQSFQHPGKTVYSIQLLDKYESKANETIPKVYKLRGDSNEINPIFFPTSDEIDYDEIRDNGYIELKAKWNHSIPASHFQLIPVKFDGWDKFDPRNKFLIFEEPKNKATYGATIDPSEGFGKGISDDAIIEIFKKGTIDYKDKQVLEFASPDLGQKAMWPFVLAAITYFSPISQLLLTIEVNDGYELQNTLIQRGWDNLYKRIDEGKIGQFEVDEKNIGFKTTPLTRPALISHFNDFFKGEWLELSSIPLIGEVKDLHKIVTASGKRKLAGAKDNRWMASMICIYALHRGEILGFEKKAWEERTRRENSEYTLKSFSEDIFGFNLDRDVRITEEGIIYSDNSFEEDFEYQFED
jgi:hypothetical protein